MLSALLGQTQLWAGGPKIRDVDNFTQVVETKTAAENEMRLLQKQQQYEEQQKAKELEYNLPKNQVQRYLDAGLNPYFQNIAAGEYGSTIAAQDYSRVADKMQTKHKTFAEQGETAITELTGIANLVTSVVTGMTQVATMNDVISQARSRTSIESFKASTQALDKGIDIFDTILDAALGFFGVGALSRFFGKKKPGAQPKNTKGGKKK